MAEYIYIKEDVDPTTMTYEIENDSGITKELSYINFTEIDDLRIYFEEDLSSEDITALDTVVSAHSGDKLEETLTENEYAIYNLQTFPMKSYVIGSITYNLDLTRNKWLSSSKRKFEFARKGNSKGMYIPLLGDLDGIDDVYTPEKPSTVTGIYCRSASGNNDKDIHIRKNGSNIYTFNYSGSLVYINNDLDFDIEITDMIQVFVDRSGSNIKNTVCRIEYAWRYDI